MFLENPVILSSTPQVICKTELQGTIQTKCICLLSLTIISMFLKYGPMGILEEAAHRLSVGVVQVRGELLPASKL